MKVEAKEKKRLEEAETLRIAEETQRLEEEQARNKAEEEYQLAIQKIADSIPTQHGTQHFTGGENSVSNAENEYEILLKDYKRLLALQSASVLSPNDELIPEEETPQPHANARSSEEDTYYEEDSIDPEDEDYEYSQMKKRYLQSLSASRVLPSDVPSNKTFRQEEDPQDDIQPIALADALDNILSQQEETPQDDIQDIAKYIALKMAEAEAEAEFEEEYERKQWEYSNYLTQAEAIKPDPGLVFINSTQEVRNSHLYPSFEKFLEMASLSKQKVFYDYKEAYALASSNGIASMIFDEVSTKFGKAVAFGLMEDIEADLEGHYVLHQESKIPCFIYCMEENDGFIAGVNISSELRIFPLSLGLRRKFDDQGIKYGARVRIPVQFQPRNYEMNARAILFNSSPPKESEYVQRLNAIKNTLTCWREEPDFTEDDLLQDECTPSQSLGNSNPKLETERHSQGSGISGSEEEGNGYSYSYEEPSYASDDESQEEEFDPEYEKMKAAYNALPKKAKHSDEENHDFPYR